MNNHSNTTQDSDPQLLMENEISTNRFNRLAPDRTIYDALILDARLRQSLVTVRSLGSRGLGVAAMGTARGLPTFASRWCQQAFVCPAEEGAQAYLAYMEKVLDHTKARVLIVSSDATVALIRSCRERIERRVSIALAKESALALAVNKEQTLEIARRLGLNIPRGLAVNAVGEVEAALHEVGLPAVAKPVESWASGVQQGVGLASKLVTTPDEARRAVEGMTSLGMTVLFQQYLPGRREAMSFLYAQGQMYARFAQWARRTMPPLGGQSVLRQSIAIPPDIGAQAECLVREIELEGYSEVEFRRDGAGNPYLMEINPRLSASVEIAVRAGVDFPYLLYQWASGEQIDKVAGYRVGGWMRYLRGDFQTTVAAVRQRGRPGVPSPARSILDFCTTFLLPTRYDYVDFRDPLPAWAAAANFTRFLLQRAGKDLSKEKSR